MKSKFRKDIEHRINKLFSKDMPLEEKLSVIFMSAGAVLSFAGAIVTVLFAQPWWQVMIHSFAVLLCLSSVLLSDNWYKSTTIALIIIGVAYFPFIYMTNAGNDGAGPMYFVMIVAFLAFYLKRKQLIIVIAFFLLYFSLFISIGYFFPELVTPYSDNVSKYIDLIIALISVSVVISLIAHKTFTSYHEEHSITHKLLAQLAEQNIQLTELSIKDQLTGVYNRRYFNEVISNQIEQYKEHKKPFHIMMIDLDDFKQVNDTHGHLFGDEVLKKVAQQINKSTREYDVIARYGGEEFCVVVSHLNPESCFTIAERIRVQVESLEFRNNVKMTVSIGLTSNSDGDTSESLVNRADKLLYQAKANGKNCVEFNKSEQY